MGFFKAYDMRGTYGVDFDLETVRKVGRALVQVLAERSPDAAGRPLFYRLSVFNSRFCKLTNNLAA